MLLQQSRAPARFDANGEIVLLDEQDRSRWNRTLIDEGRLLLKRASVYQDPGPYQLQAAIAALHAHATRPEDTLWKEIDSLYQALEALQPSTVVTLNHAVAVWKLQGAEVAAAKTPWGWTVEFKLPWANFPEFAPKVGEIIGNECELCSSDGPLGSLPPSQPAWAQSEPCTTTPSFLSKLPRA